MARTLPQLELEIRGSLYLGPFRLRLGYFLSWKGLNCRHAPNLTPPHPERCLQNGRSLLGRTAYHIIMERSFKTLPKIPIWRLHSLELLL